jgi:hypothetical protein
MNSWKVEINAGKKVRRDPKDRHQKAKPMCKIMCIRIKHPAAAATATIITTTTAAPAAAATATAAAATATTTS